MTTKEDSAGASGSSATTVLVAFAVGALAGAAVALLFAPASGEETRRRLGDKARRGRDAAGRLAREGREFVDRQRENVQEMIDRGREAFDRAKESL